MPMMVLNSDAVGIPIRAAYHSGEHCSHSIISSVIFQESFCAEKLAPYFLLRDEMNVLHADAVLAGNRGQRLAVAPVAFVQDLQDLRRRQFRPRHWLAPS